MNKEERDKAKDSAIDLLNNNKNPFADASSEPIKYYNMLLPTPIELSSIWKNRIELSPEIIRGVLREGHKMMLTGPSKAGKTFALMELAVAIATGREWFGFKCRKGRCLYINLELADNSCYSRFKKIGEVSTIKLQDVNNIIIWNLRGYAIPFTDLAPIIADLVKASKLDIVIIDPIYKVFSGSENDQEAATVFCNNLDLIAKAGASVVYCHHHSKGIQGNKSTMDRGSGSGVFARDADALLDLIEINLPGGAPIDPKDPSVTAWQLEGILREFTPFQPKKIYFRYPLHEVCNDGALCGAKPKTSRTIGGNTRGAQRETEAINNYKRFISAYEEMSANGQTVRVKEIAERISLSEKTVRRYAGNGGFIVSGGRILKNKDRDAS